MYSKIANTSAVTQLDLEYLLLDFSSALSFTYCSIPILIFEGSIGRLEASLIAMERYPISPFRSHQESSSP